MGVQLGMNALQMEREAENLTPIIFK